jgi:hypothetical protein
MSDRKFSTIGRMVDYFVHRSNAQTPVRAALRSPDGKISMRRELQTSARPVLGHSLPYPLCRLVVRLLAGAVDAAAVRGFLAREHMGVELQQRRAVSD